METRNKKQKISIVISILWSLVIIITVDNILDYGQSFSDFLISYIIYGLPIWSYWTIKWIWGNHFLNSFIWKDDVRHLKRDKKKLLFSIGISIGWIIGIITTLSFVSIHDSMSTDRDLVPFIIFSLPVWVYWLYIFILKNKQYKLEKLSIKQKTKISSTIPNSKEFIENTNSNLRTEKKLGKKVRYWRGPIFMFLTFIIPLIDAWIYYWGKYDYVLLYAQSLGTWLLIISIPLTIMILNRIFRKKESSDGLYVFYYIYSMIFEIIIILPDLAIINNPKIHNNEILNFGTDLLFGAMYIHIVNILLFSLPIIFKRSPKL